MNRRAFLVAVTGMMAALRVHSRPRPDPFVWDLSSFKVYTAPIGTPFPARDDAPQSPWMPVTTPKLFIAAPTDADFL